MEMKYGMQKWSSETARMAADPSSLFEQRWNSWLPGVDWSSAAAIGWDADTSYKARASLGLQLV